ncbi:hypothetical protein [Puia dinghuensis]|uniref:Uncharacterized protein n=1 Tax=Puia dinghuensis TaxID=1792502 RepID=A0A8J2U6U7_9BACT|nr:hypothetical protein [Puia dinghuensis]GGA82477.1 hypothetical protein GCM10011511_01810 [Puia dinghuensis]
MRRLLYICAFLAVHGALSAQTVSGSWYGHADVEMAGIHNNYLTELIIRQKGTRVDGIFGYYFRDKYQSFFIHGRYDPKSRQITILNIPMIYYGSVSTLNSVDCNTHFKGILLTSRAGSSVKGFLLHDAKYRYTCPDIKVSYILDKSDNQTDSTISAGLASARIWKPQEDDLVVDAVQAATPAQPTVSLPPPAEQKATTDSAQTTIAPAKATVAAPPADPEKEDNKKIVESFVKRKSVLKRVLEVESDSVRLSFYDNGEIDGDSISVFVNGQLAVIHKELAAKAFNLFLRLDSTRDINEVGMYAENLGRIPPNTALMVVTDGKNRYEVFMSSSFTENATIQLKRKKSALAATQQP